MTIQQVWQSTELLGAALCSSRSGKLYSLIHIVNMFNHVQNNFSSLHALIIDFLDPLKIFMVALVSHLLSFQILPLLVYRDYSTLRQDHRTWQRTPKIQEQ